MYVVTVAPLDLKPMRLPLNKVCDNVTILPTTVLWRMVYWTIIERGIFFRRVQIAA